VMRGKPGCCLAREHGAVRQLVATSRPLQHNQGMPGDLHGVREASRRCGSNFTVNSVRCWMLDDSPFGQSRGFRAQSLCLFCMAVGLAKHRGTAQLIMVL
jgi:hypothetical protein